ncbi:isoprenylcysteine carboxylmethyltransferase family protein [Lysobacter yangpyeongensis]|uniref:Isoprenylcysteine carboxylmethyltransferase family protein n=1 Tax=Lysobacter yangpyeongensis TaxID=346182 RepID=A0ABW0SNI1_9GAMM
MGDTSLNGKPETAVPGRVSLAGATGALAAWLMILVFRPSPILGTVLFLMACALPMWWMELRRFPRPARRANTLRSALTPGTHNWRFRLRLLGLMGFLFALSLTFHAFRQFSADYISGLMQLLPVAAPLAAGWALWILLRAPRGLGRDSLESLGLALTHATRRRFSTNDRQAVLGWMVKAFYLPIMISSVYAFLHNAFDPDPGKHGWWKVYAMVYQSLFAVDTAFATIGYCSTSRRIGAHIRSTEPTVLGWAAALVCYPPLNVLILHRWLSYDDGYDWISWLHGYPVLTALWAVAILSATGLYAWATVAFGPRFSNLTNRGIITSGPYSWFKHPSYLGKNLAWWLISIPFISTSGPVAALANCAALLALGIIYVVRAKTEERHLMSDPTYQSYCNWIEQHGFLPRIKRKFLPAPLREA